MAIKQDYVDRTKAVGFYKNIEWNTAKGILVSIYFADKNGKTRTVFERAHIDLEYDQRFDDHRKVFMTRRDTVRFMLNLGMQTVEIARTFQLLDGGTIVSTSK